MGTVYYLVRDDNKTAFELGKGHDWQDVFEPFGDERDCGDVYYLNVTIMPEYKELLIQQLNKFSVERQYMFSGLSDYLARVASDIIQFADGQPLQFTADTGDDRTWEYNQVGDSYLKKTDGA